MNSPKYPRTYHLPWSLGCTDDDKRAKDVSSLLNIDIVVTEKMDGSNCSLEHNACYARTHSDVPSHKSFDVIKSLHANIKYQLPIWHQFFGENLYAKHSIFYDKLPHHFMLFNVREYNDKGDGFWYDWLGVQEWAEELKLPTVPVLYHGKVKTEAELKELTLSFMNEPSVCGDTREGIVVRDIGIFKEAEFSKKVMKLVRANHVQTSEHWKNQEIVKNLLKQ